MRSYRTSTNDLKKDCRKVSIAMPRILRPRGCIVVLMSAFNKPLPSPLGQLTFVFSCFFQVHCLSWFIVLVLRLGDSTQHMIHCINSGLFTVCSCSAPAFFLPKSLSDVPFKSFRFWRFCVDPCECPFWVPTGNCSRCSQFAHGLGRKIFWCGNSPCKWYLTTGSIVVLDGFGPFGSFAPFGH